MSPNHRSAPLSQSRRMAAVQSPIIPVLGELIQAHSGTISLAQGVAYYGPPESTLKRISDFLSDPLNHRYGPTPGVPDLIELITQKLRNENGITCKDNYRVVVTAGANMGFLNALFAIADPGDEIILSVPYYFNHEMAIRMVNCRPVLVPTCDRYQLSHVRIRAAISDRTRAVVTISPNNPSGAVYPESSLRHVNAICKEHSIYHINDEAYENFTYGGVRHFSPGSIEGAEHHTISLYSLSKAYGFASWRIGYMVVPTHLYMAILKAQDTNLICPSLIAQFGAIGALETGSAYCREKRKMIEDVREILVRELVPLKTFCSIAPADGAFYILIKVETEHTPIETVERLIKDHRVAVVPGSTFGLDTGCYLRVAYGALERHTAAEGFQRLVRGLTSINNCVNT